ncbi:unnamed protein product [Sympodiomycopsis kandeliae]
MTSRPRPNSHPPAGDGAAQEEVSTTSSNNDTSAAIAPGQDQRPADEQHQPDSSRSPSQQQQLHHTRTDGREGRGSRRTGGNSGSSNWRRGPGTINAFNQGPPFRSGSIPATGPSPPHPAPAGAIQGRPVQYEYISHTSGPPAQTYPAPVGYEQPFQQHFYPPPHHMSPPYGPGPGPGHPVMQSPPPPQATSNQPPVFGGGGPISSPPDFATRISPVEGSAVASTQDPAQPYITQTEQGMTYYTYGPFPRPTNEFYQHTQPPQAHPQHPQHTSAFQPLNAAPTPAPAAVSPFSNRSPYMPGTSVWIQSPPSGQQQYPLQQQSQPQQPQSQPQQPVPPQHMTSSQLSWRSGGRDRPRGGSSSTSGASHALRTMGALPNIASTDVSPAGAALAPLQEPATSSVTTATVTSPAAVMTATATSPATGSTDPSLSPTNTSRPPNVAQASAPSLSGMVASAEPQPQAAAPPRSEHVMWVGNVPADATQDELMAYFSSMPVQSGELQPADGILSIFIIARSNCAFVNFASATLLEQAVTLFDGSVIRPGGAKATKLVCRVRKKEEEAASGVAGQRGKGIHVGWLKEYNRRRREEEASSASHPSNSGRRTSPAAPDRDNLPSESAASTSSESTSNLGGEDAISASSAEVSYASTNSEVLRHPAFERRFFILKSRDGKELDNAVQTGLWSTQPHNEKVLNQAYRNSEDVILIFSANQSGAFYGFAKMNGPIGGATQVEKSAARDVDRSSPNAAPATTAARGRGEGAPNLFHRDVVNASPESLLPVQTSEGQDIPSLNVGVGTTSSLPGATRSAIAIGPSHQSLPASVSRQDSPPQTAPAQVSSVPMDRDATLQPDVATSLALDTSSARSYPGPLGDGVLRRDMAFPRSASIPREDAAADVQRSGTVVPAADLPSSPGDEAMTQQALQTGATIHNLRLNQCIPADSEQDVQVSTTTITTTQVASAPRDAGAAADRQFPLLWLQTTSLPFSMVRQLRNPWNEGRSVRVARDGTEVAIDTGVELLAVWDRYAPPASPASHPTSHAG